MKIISKVKTTIKGVQIFPGIRDYPIDHKDPLAEQELYILKFEQKKINFSEILSMEKVKADEKKELEAQGIERAKKRQERINKVLDKKLELEKKEAAKKKKAKDVRRGNKATGKVGRDGSSDSSGGGVSDEGKDKSTARKPLSKRWDSENKGRPIRAKSSKKE